MPPPPARDRPDDVRRPDFEFCVVGRPVSAQALRRASLQAWKAKVSAAATAAWPASQQPFGGDLELRVTHYSERRIADRDNLLKPIQDAIQGIAYSNDRQVKDATSNWRNINGRFVVRSMSLPLAVAFSGGDEFLHIRLWRSRGQEDLG
ncbi:RusA family crossover junction endodeoxyribonuclease [Methylobacterium sp. 17Sr1-1]|uniref:RusA family crossover junction endodeoxyribonuclease n=1 Tax=Methylobacterium sp. 17Sr1-1 TaxID=2202826 RepID=UPI000D6F83C1|nr:RusA family crossover junction endodeoxyribonuclease [Methylobacterium sp. 17Sr1-1]AWN51690.1 RusA family crossover junction endodeoxyribonuclease [Methylobacterium sp. 17Sr1-1]